MFVLFSFLSLVLEKYIISAKRKAGRLKKMRLKKKNSFSPCTQRREGVVYGERGISCLV
jgi:hypothetical protein